MSSPSVIVAKAKASTPHSKASANCATAHDQDGNVLDSSYPGSDQTTISFPQITHDYQVTLAPEKIDLSGVKLGQYQLQQSLGEGSMGQVYEAMHLGLHRSCAIKIVDPRLIKNQPHLLDRFRAEARAIARMSHPNVVGVYNLGTESDYHFIEMELVPGGNTLRQQVVREGPLDPAKAVQWCREVALGLAEAHRCGLIHRDVKPSNILLSPDQQVKLADFGLVRRLDEKTKHAGARQRSPKPATTPLDPVAAAGLGQGPGGTPAFMAPELFSGEPSSPQSDFYALGITLYYLLTARLPYIAPRIGRLIKMHEQSPIPNLRELVPDASEELVAIIGRCLAKKPSERFVNGEDLAEALQFALFAIRDIDDLIQQSIKDLNALVQGGKGSFRLICPVPNDRIQEVYVERGLGRRGEQLITVFSICCPSDPAHYEFALKLNAELTFGGLSIRKVGGEEMFVLSRNLPLGQVGPVELHNAIRDVSRLADRVEHRLTNADVF